MFLVPTIAHQRRKGPKGQGEGGGKEQATPPPPSPSSKALGAEEVGVQSDVRFNFGLFHA